jgi:hypothetical protein
MISVHHNMSHKRCRSFEPSLPRARIVERLLHLSGNRVSLDRIEEQANTLGSRGPRSSSERWHYSARMCVERPCETYRISIHSVWCLPPNTQLDRTVLVNQSLSAIRLTRRHEFGFLLCVVRVLYCVRDLVSDIRAQVILPTSDGGENGAFKRSTSFVGHVMMHADHSQVKSATRGIHRSPRESLSLIGE